MSAQKRKIPVQMTAMMTDVKNVVTFSVRKYVAGRPRMHAIEYFRHYLSQLRDLNYLNSSTN